MIQAQFLPLNSSNAIVCNDFGLNQFSDNAGGEEKYLNDTE